MKHKFKLFIVSVFTFCITLTGNISVFGASFADISDVPWNGAEEYINSAADIGLMTGDKNELGQQVFRAKDKVTYCETVQLVYNLIDKTSNMKETENAETKWKAVMSGYNIPTWAHEAVAYCLDNSVVSTTDISSFMKNSTDNNYATREDVAVIFGKALSSIKDINTAASLSFSDANEIAQSSVPYVELLQRLGVITGDSDGNFNPKNYINRAEMAVIVSNVYEECKTEVVVIEKTQFSGSVTGFDDMGGSYLISVLNNGTTMGFIANSLTSVTNNGETVSASTITIGDTITVEYEGTTVNKITIDYDVVKSAETIEGELDEITSQKLYIILSTGLEASYYIAEDIEITLNGNTSTALKLMNACDEGTVDVEITLDSNNDVMSIEAVGTESSSSSDDTDGKISTLTSSYIKLSGDSTSYEIDDEDDIEISVEDGTVEDEIDDFDTLKDAFDDGKTIYVTVYYEDDIVTEIEGEITKVEGEIYGINTSSNKIQIKTDSGNYSYKYEDEDYVDCELDGDSIDLSELEEAFDDDDIEIEITLEDGYIVEIIAETV